MVFVSGTAKETSDRSTTEGILSNDDKEMRNSEKHHHDNHTLQEVQSNEGRSKNVYNSNERLYTLTSTGRKGFLNEEHEKTISQRYPQKKYTPQELQTKETL